VGYTENNSQNRRKTNSANKKQYVTARESLIKQRHSDTEQVIAGNKTVETETDIKKNATCAILVHCDLNLFHVISE
jgi:hypothetical protein